MTEYKARQVLKLLKEHGFTYISSNGDHHKFTNDSGLTTIVPYKHLGDTIMLGTYKAILKQAHIKL